MPQTPPAILPVVAYLGDMKRKGNRYAIRALEESPGHAGAA
jgi:hypothetical protein